MRAMIDSTGKDIAVRLAYGAAVIRIARASGPSDGTGRDLLAETTEQNYEVGPRGTGMPRVVNSGCANRRDCGQRASGRRSRVAAVRHCESWRIRRDHPMTAVDPDTGRCPGMCRHFGPRALFVPHRRMAFGRPLDRLGVGCERWRRREECAGDGKQRRQQPVPQTEHNSHAATLLGACPRDFDLHQWSATDHTGLCLSAAPREAWHRGRSRELARPACRALPLGSPPNSTAHATATSPARAA
jgi:hypothetical protein